MLSLIDEPQDKMYDEIAPTAVEPAETAMAT